MTKTTTTCFQRAKYAQIAERFDDMIEILEELPMAPLTAEGMDLLAAAYTNAVEIRRGSVEKLRSSTAKEEKSSVESYIEKIESEIAGICQNLLDKIEEINVLVAVDDDTKPYYGLMEERFRGYELDSQIEGYLGHLPKKNHEDLFPEVLSILQDTPQKTTLALHLEELLSNLPGPDTLQPLDSSL